MRNWIEQYLGGLLIEEKKSTIQVQGASNFGDYPFFTSGDNILVHDTFIVDGERLFLATGGKANIKFYNGKAAYSTDTYVLRSEKASTKFLYYYVLNKLEFVNSNLFTGSGLKHLQKNEFKKLKFLLPESKPEQTRIAEILSTADETIAHTEALIAKYQRIKTGLMQDLLNKGIDENGNIRSKETHKFVVKNGIEVPEEWEVKQIIKTTYLKARIGWQGLKASEFIIEGPYLVTGTDFQSGRINWKSCYHVTEERFQEAKYIQLKETDLLITKDGTIGKTALVKNCPDKAVLNSGVFILRCNDGSYINEFMYHILNSKYFVDFLYKTQGGSTINHLYQREFEKFYFPCPDITEQGRIVNIINQSIDLIEEEELKLKKLQSLKTGLMQDLLSGRVSLPAEMIKEAGVYKDKKN